MAHMVLKKYVKFILLTTGMVSSATPFLNGLGCDYSLYYEDERIITHGSCRSGILNIVIQRKGSGKIIQESYLWGVMGTAFYSFRIGRFHNPLPENTSAALFDSTSFLAGRYKVIDNINVITYFKHPVSTIRLNNINGKLAFFYKQ